MAVRPPLHPKTNAKSLLPGAIRGDGEYEDEETGLKFPDPMGRSEGEYLSLRFGELHFS